MDRNRESPLRRIGIVVLFAAALLVACERNQYAPPPPPEVTVARPIDREVTIYLDFTGRTEAVEAVEIRARVEGRLESMHFDPASDVEKGALLFVIEPARYEAAAARARADLARAKADLQAAEEQLEITRAIYERKAGSRADLVARTQTRNQAKALVAQAEAALVAAELDLSYTHVYAPIAGRIDRNYVDPGNLVGAVNEPTLLATIVRQDPIYAYFEASERELLEYRARERLGQTAAAEGETVEAHLGLATEEGHPHHGVVDYAANRVDPSTGTYELRAVFPNADGVLLPGLFARVRLPFRRHPARLVPDAAVGTDQGGRYVLVVDDEGTVEQRRIVPGPLVDEMRVVDEGLEPGDRIVVKGLQRARAGSRVTAVEVGAGVAAER
jgi:RND family efflux transporter MFP subunit